MSKDRIPTIPLDVLAAAVGGLLGVPFLLILLAPFIGSL